MAASLSASSLDGRFNRMRAIAGLLLASLYLYSSASNAGDCKYSVVDHFVDTLSAAVVAKRNDGGTPH